MSNNPKPSSGGPPPGVAGPGDVREEVNLIERVMDALGTDDEFLAALVANQSKLAEIEQRENELIEQLVALNDSNVCGPATDSYQYEFSRLVPADTSTDSPVTTTREIEFAGRVTALAIGWPDGASNVVGVGFRTSSGERLFPRNKEDEYVAANDFSTQFDLRSSISANSELVAHFANNDPNNDHFVNVIATVEAIPGGDA